MFILLIFLLTSCFARSYVVTEPDAIISQKMGYVATLKQVCAENNQPMLITLTDKVQIWQNVTGSWQAETLELLCNPISMQVITDPEAKQPDIIVGGQSCFNSDNGVFVVFQQDENGWQTYSSDTIDKAGAFYNINAFVTPDNYLDVAASGSINNKIYFFEWAEKQWFEISCLPLPDRVANATIETFYLPNGTSYLTSANVNETALNFWIRTAEDWQFSQQISTSCGEVTTYDYSVTNGLPTLVAGCGSGLLLTSQLSNNVTWSEPSYTKAHTSAVSSLSHVVQNGAVVLMTGSHDGTIKLWQRINNTWQIASIIYVPNLLVIAADAVSDTTNSTVVVSAGYGEVGCVENKSCTLGLWRINSTWENEAACV